MSATCDENLFDKTQDGIMLRVIIKILDGGRMRGDGLTKVIEKSRRQDATEYRAHETVFRVYVRIFVLLFA
jgi:hypothetical protein